jgi:hypothetical protein
MSDATKIYYRIKDWEKHFENNRTREMKKMAWVPVPNKHDGESYKRIMQEKDGIVIYGCWHLILQVASKAKEPQDRGTLLRDDRTPITAEAIAVRTGWSSVQDFERALQFLASPEIAWLEVVTQDGDAIPHPPAAIPHPPARKGIEGKGTERTEEKDPNRIEMRLARSLLDSILSWKPDYKKPASLDAWADDIEKAIRLDKRPPDKLEAIINWIPSHVGTDGFTWKANILSGAKLRAQYDKLDIAMKKPLSKKEISYVQP